MVTDARKVDADVLQRLGNETATKRQALEAVYNQLRNRVDSAPARWDRGEWDGTRSFMRLELEQMDRERNELANRAWSTAVWAAISELPGSLPLSAWKFLLSSGAPLGIPFGALPVAAAAITASLAAFVKQFTVANGRKPTVAEMTAGVGGGAVAGRPVTTSPHVASTPSPGTGAQQANLSNWWKGKAGTGVGYAFDGKTYQCVALAQDWAKNGLGQPTGPFDGNSANGAWEAGVGGTAFAAGEWQKIPKGAGSAYQPGDLVFFPPNDANGGDGHVAVVATAPVNGKFTVYQQNWSGKLAEEHQFPVNDTLGVIRKVN